MKNKMKVILSLFVALIILLIVYKVVNKEQEVDIVTDDTNDNNYVVTSFSVAEIESIEYTIGNEVNTFYKTERGYQLDNSDLKINNTVLNNSATLTANFLSNQKFDEENFGTNRNDYMTKVVLKNAEEIIFSVGDKTPDGLYNYVKVSGGLEDGIYLIPNSAMQLLVVSNDFASSKNIEQIEFETMSKIVINQRDYQNLVLAIPEEEYLIEDNLHGISTLIMESPYPNKTIFMQSFIDEVFGTITDFKFNTLVENDAKDLKIYGLDEPFLHINVVSDNGVINLLVGDKDEEGNYFVKNYDENHVFTMDYKILAPYIDINCFYFLNRFVAPISIDKVDGVRYQIMNNDFVITKNNINGVDISEEDFSTIYRALVSVEFDIFLGEYNKENKEVYASISYDLKDGTNLLYEFYSYDDNFVAYFDEQSNLWFLISKDYLEDAYKHCLNVG